jgi:hypothetical protein
VVQLHPLGDFHIDMAEVRTKEGQRRLLVAMTVSVDLPMPN